MLNLNNLIEFKHYWKQSGTKEHKLILRFFLRVKSSEGIFIKLDPIFQDVRIAPESIARSFKQDTGRLYKLKKISIALRDIFIHQDSCDLANTTWNGFWIATSTCLETPVEERLVQPRVKDLL